MFNINNNVISSSEECEFSPVFKTIFCTLLFTTGICAIVENLFFCFVVFHNKKMQKKSTVLLVSLSINDIVISMFVPTIYFCITYYWPHLPFSNTWVNIFNCAWIFSVVSPFMTVMAITVERYIAITKRNVYTELYSNVVIATVVATLWVYSFLWVVAMEATCKNITGHNKYVWNVSHKLYYTFIWLHLFVPMVTIPILYYLIIRHVKMSRRATLTCLHSSVHSKVNAEIKLAGTVAYVVVLLYVVWIPILILETLYTEFYSICGIKKADIVSVWLASLNCCLNPIIYSHRNPEVKKYTKRIFNALTGFFLCSCRGCQGYDEVGEESSTTDQHEYSPL